MVASVPGVVRASAVHADTETASVHSEFLLHHQRERLLLPRARPPYPARPWRKIGLDVDSHVASQDLEGLSRALKRALFVCPNHRGLHAMRGEVHRRLQVGVQVAR